MRSLSTPPFCRVPLTPAGAPKPTKVHAPTPPRRGTSLEARPLVDLGGRSGSVDPQGLPSERAFVRAQLQNQGVPVYTGVYPPDVSIPAEMANRPLSLPFPPGVWAWVQQGNNTMADPTSHAPDQLRYAVDLVPSPPGESRVTAPLGGIAYVYRGARPEKGDNWGFGNFVLIDHRNGYATMLAHLSRTLVPNGATVRAGQQVGILGDTGLAGNKHVHMQVVRLLRKPNPATEQHHEGQTSPLIPFSGPVAFQIQAVSNRPGLPLTRASTTIHSAEAGYLPDYAEFLVNPKER